MTRISALTALTSADSGDTLPILDVSATTTKKITKTAFISDIVDGTLIAAQAITATKADFSVADATARTALTAFEGLICYQKDVDVTYIYDGSAWRKSAQWEELGRLDLTPAGDTLSLTSLPARKYLRIIYSVQSTGGTINTRLRFNNDTANNYAWMELSNWLTYSNNTSQGSIALSATLMTSERFACLDIVNISAQRKLFHGYEVDDNSAAATSSSNNKIVFGKWDNVSTQITRVDLTNVSGAGTFAAGSELIVLGRN